jgi:hypothetical protein
MQAYIPLFSNLSGADFPRSPQGSDIRTDDLCLSYPRPASSPFVVLWQLDTTLFDASHSFYFMYLMQS